MARARDAIKAWGVSVQEVPDHEGPDFHDIVAWDAWFRSRMRPGEPITVLVEPRGKRWTMYGQLEGFVERADGVRVFAAA